LEIIHHKLRNFRIRLEEVVKDLHELTQRVKSEPLAQNASDLRERIREPFMFVIVGEVKAGKSSFINALLATEKEICKVAPDPCTDTIQQVLYGEEDTLVVNPYLKKIFHPIDILKEIAIVDTPGTNTIIQHHQEITERFIPVSDLIVFVFEAKNPYRQSAWDFFDFIHAEWRKKIMFVLQQADLMEPHELEVNIKGVAEQAEKKGIKEAKVFAVSAKTALKGDWEASGMDAVSAFIQQHITGGKAPWLKIENNIDTAFEINQKIDQGLQLRAQQLTADQKFRAEVKETLFEQGDRSNQQVEVLVENLIASYDRITRQTEKDLSRGLGFFTLVKRSFLSLFSKKESAQGWLKDLTDGMERDLKDELSVKINNGVINIADSIQQMAKMIDLKIKSSKTILENDQEIFADIADKRVQVMHDLQKAFAKFLNRSENFIDESVIPKDTQFAPDIAKGGGLAVIGVVVATVTKGMAFDITGGILSAIGLLFAGITVGLKKHKVMQSFQKEVDQGRQAIQQEITEKLARYIETIKQRIETNFHDFDAMLALEEKEVVTLRKQFDDISGNLLAMKQKLNNIDSNK